MQELARVKLRTSLRVPALDGLRGVAILAVLLFHFAPGGTSILNGGFLGVDLFFVLSGFLITSLLLEERRVSGRFELIRFYVRRMLRLLPALYVLLFVVGAYAHFVLPDLERQKVYRGIVSSLFYYSNWVLAKETAALHMLNHTWSLSIEEQFYICFPIVLTLYFYLSDNLRVLALILFVGALCSAYLMTRYYTELRIFDMPYQRTDSRVTPILLGGAMAVLHSFSRFRAGVILALFGLAAMGALFYTADFKSPFMYRGGFLVFALASALLVSHCGADCPSVLKTVLSIRPLRFLGSLSYSLYLWHFPVYVAVSVAHPGPQTLGDFLLGTSLALLAASLSFYFVEKPFLRLKEKFSLVHLASVRDETFSPATPERALSAT